jgi:uncharacterized phage protein (TIGR02218 family)
MTYTAKELSVQDGQPVEVFEFVGTFKTYRYTSADRPLTFFGEVYTPLAIKRDEANIGDQSQDGIEMVIELPQTSEVVTDYVFNISPIDLVVTIFRCHVGLDYTTEPIVFWVGNVTGWNIEEDIAKVRVPSLLESTMQGNFPNFFYQQSCNHTLFDARCGVNKAANTFVTTVVSVDGFLVTVNDPGVVVDFLKGGVMSIQGVNESRLIMNNDGRTITVFYPFSRIAVGDTVELTTGCDHTKATCKAKFDNVRRFGGFPYIPTDNPFVGVLS